MGGMTNRIRRPLVLTAILLASIRLPGRERSDRLEMRLRRYAHQQGILWSPSYGWTGVPFGNHGVRSLPVDEHHAAMVIASTERAHAGMAQFGGMFDDEEGSA
jgi:hypothetical protein